MEERVGEGGRKEEKEEDDFLAPPPNPFGDSKTSLEDVRSEPLVGDVDDEEEQGELLHMFLSSMEQLQMSPLRNRRGGENEDKAKKDKVEEGGKRRENIIQHPPSPVSEEHPIPSPTLPSPSPPPSPPSFSHYSSQKLNRRQPPVHQHQPASTKRQDRHNHNEKLRHPKEKPSPTFNVCFIKELFVVAVCMSAIFLVVSMFVLGSNPKLEPPTIES